MLADERNDPEYGVYCFKEFNHMLDACGQLRLSGYSGNRRKWTEEGIPRYYPAVEKAEKAKYSFFDEYGISVYHTRRYICNRALLLHLWKTKMLIDSIFHLSIKIKENNYDNGRT